MTTIQHFPVRTGPVRHRTLDQPTSAPVLKVSEADACTRDEIAARAAACRRCPHVATGGATCAACDLRCAHPAASRGSQLLARKSSICPADRWAT